MTAALVGRRAQVTRGRIEHAASSLFRRHGFEDVTVGDVARAAGVSPATFYRHFPTKEDVVVSYGASYSGALQVAAATIGAGVPRCQHLPLVLLSFASWLGSQQEVLALQHELVAGHPALVSRTLAVQRQLEHRLATLLAELSGAEEPDPATTVSAAVGMAVLRAAVCSWQAGSSPSIEAATRGALADLRDLLRYEAV